MRKGKLHIRYWNRVAVDYSSRQDELASIFPPVVEKLLGDVAEINLPNPGLVFCRRRGSPSPPAAFQSVMALFFQFLVPGEHGFNVGKGRMPERCQVDMHEHE